MLFDEKKPRTTKLAKLIPSIPSFNAILNKIPNLSETVKVQAYNRPLY